MKKALTLLLAAALSSLASAVTYKWTKLDLPSSTNVSETAYSVSLDNTAQFVSNLKGKNTGVYAGGAGGTIGNNWGSTTLGNNVSGQTGNGDNEGKWVYDSTTKTGSMTLAYRNAAGGDYVGLVLGGMTPDSASDLLQYTFSLGNNTGNKISTQSLYATVGIVRDGNVLKCADTETVSVPAKSNVELKTVEVDLKTLLGEAFEWAEGDKIVLVIRGIKQDGLSNTANYTIDDISVSLGAIVPDTPPGPVEGPEPTVLALLALGVAGVALRRKVA